MSNNHKGHDHGNHEGHNHEGHEGHEGHDKHRFTMRLPSPLPADMEAVTARVIGCAIAVHRQLGPGFLESIYKKAMRLELTKAGLPYESEKAVDVMYDGIAIHGQRLDLVVAEAIVVELKSVKTLEDIHRAQIMSYLKATGLRVGLLVNFRVSALHHGIRRIVV
jgi:GxxExxY protein